MRRSCAKVCSKHEASSQAMMASDVACGICSSLLNASASASCVPGHAAAGISMEEAAEVLRQANARVVQDWQHAGAPGLQQCVWVAPEAMSPGRSCWPVFSHALPVRSACMHACTKACRA